MGFRIRALAPDDQAQWQDQWRAYLTRNTLPGAPADFGRIGEVLQIFLGPVWTALAAGVAFTDRWQPGGPWTASTPAREQLA